MDIFSFIVVLKLMPLLFPMTIGASSRQKLEVQSSSRQNTAEASSSSTSRMNKYSMEVRNSTMTSEVKESKIEFLDSLSSVVKEYNTETRDIMSSEVKEYSTETMDSLSSEVKEYIIQTRDIISSEVKEYSVEASVVLNRCEANTVTRDLEEDVKKLPESTTSQVDNEVSFKRMEAGAALETRTAVESQPITPPQTDADRSGARHSAVIRGCLAELECAVGGAREGDCVPLVEVGKKAAAGPPPPMEVTCQQVVTSQVEAVTVDKKLTQLFSCSALRSILMSSSLETDESETDTEDLAKDLTDTETVRGDSETDMDDADEKKRQEASKSSSIFMTECSTSDNDTSFSVHYRFGEEDARLDKRRRNRTIDLHDLPSLVWAATVCMYSTSTVSLTQKTMPYSTYCKKNTKLKLGQ